MLPESVITNTFGTFLYIFQLLPYVLSTYNLYVFYCRLTLEELNKLRGNLEDVVKLHQSLLSALDECSKYVIIY